MCEEYLSADEITKKIAELKIRLALHLEFEQEVNDVVAESNIPDAVRDQSIKEMEESALRDISVQFEGGKSNKQKRRLSRASRIAIAAAVLILVSLGSALATAHMIQNGVLKLNAQTYSERTSYTLVSTGKTVDIPEEWNGDFYPTYIPEGYEFEKCYHSEVVYRNENEETFSFSEETYGASISLDTEDANVSSIMINGASGTVIEKEGWIAIIWSANNRVFTVDMIGTKEEALRIAVSVTLIE